MELSSISIAITSLVGALFSPGAMFTTGVNGAWYDPSDFSTMFQNAAGTTPVTAVGQPVGLMLDKSKGSVLGPELVTNGDFSNGTTGWTIGANITASVAAGEAVVNFVGSISSTSNNWFAANSPSTANKRYRIEFDATYVSGGDLQAGTDWTVGKTITGASNAGVKTRYSLDVSSQATLSVFGLVTFGSTTTATWKLDNISVRELPGNHAFNPSGNSANFPVLQQDGTGRYYLAFNGVNQWLQTNSIDFTYGDKMFVSAGVRKLSDAALGTVVGLTTGITSNNGAFRLAAPGSAAPNLEWSAKGTTQVDLTSTTYTAPITSIVSGTADISGSSTIQRINGAQTASSASSLGTGNFSNAALYLGASGGTANWLNGRLYGLVVAGKQASASEITSTEAWLNSKTGAY